MYDQFLFLLISLQWVCIVLFIYSPVIDTWFVFSLGLLETWHAAVHGVAELDVTEQLKNNNNNKQCCYYEHSLRSPYVNNIYFNLYFIDSQEWNYSWNCNCNYMKLTNCFPKLSYHTTFLQVDGVLVSSHPHKHLFSFYFNHSSGCKIVSRCFYFYFSNNNE